MWRRWPRLREHPGVANVDELLQDIRTALDPVRFLAALGETEEGHRFLSGQSDTVPLSRGFLDTEAAIARRGLEALEAIARFLSYR